MGKGQEDPKGEKPAMAAGPHGGSGEDTDFLTDPEAVASVVSAKEEELPLGERVRLARQKKGLSLSDLSTRTGIDTETLAQVESNEYLPPLGELIRLGKALAMKMGYFISPGREPFTVVRSDQRRPISRFGKERPLAKQVYVYESLAPDKKDRFMEPFLVTLLPTEIEEVSQHDGQEFIYVLEGAMDLRVGEYRDVLHPGDAVYYDSQTPHLVKAHGDRPAKILAVLYS